MSKKNIGHVLITGASSGLGAAVARKLSKLGYVLTVAARTTSQLEQLAEELNQSTQARVFPITMDVSSWEDVDLGTSDAFGRHGPFSGVVHCAGVLGPFGPISRVSSTEWENAIRTNLVGTFNLTKSISGKFREQESTFITLSGGGATKPMPYMTSYAASKSGLVRFIESVALDQEFGAVSCIVLAPGPMKTRMLDQILNQDIATIGTHLHELAQSSASKSTGNMDRAVDFIARFVEQPELRLSGRLVSAVWDPWDEWLKGDFSALEHPDNFTLRRVVHEN